MHNHFLFSRGRKSIFLALGGILLSCSVSMGQDAIFSQYYASSLYLNPALAGIEPSLTVGSNYRTQWRNVTDPYITSQVSLIKPIYTDEGENHSGGIGISLYNDQSGLTHFQTNGINISGAWNIYLSEYKMQSLTLGIQAGVMQRRLSFSDLRWGSQYNPDGENGFDPTLDPETSGFASSSIFPDISAGLLYYYNAGRDYSVHNVSGYFGLSAYHLNRPNESLLEGEHRRLPTLYKMHGGIEWHLSERVNISPNFIVARQSNAMQYNGGLYLTFILSEGESVLAPSEIITGAWYRVFDSFIGALGFGNKYYTLAFSYDVNNTSLRHNSIGRGAYEISLRITRPRVGTTKRFYTPRI
ncbi:PorP/SprF family type IX secretion system membrane protein [Cytophagaceae bacterium ABcell3]|nr:PorP/SprF family type IX secretion system membrane protein [Cytophagaceae bacterium ABcell3]